MTPDNGEVSRHPTGYVTHQNMGKLATLTSSLYIEPVRESILSYTGMRDPYTGKQWGRVLRKGIRLNSLQQLGNNWSLSGAINLEYLDGESVESNRHAGVFASVGKNLDLPAFSYAVVGLGFNYDHYEENLSHFTLGHGGYFSPDRFVSIGPSFDFLTRENQQFIVKGRLAFASVSIAEAASPWFPGNDDGNSYAASKNNGMSYTAEASGVWRINDRLQLGGALSERNAPQYKDETAMLFLRVLFESRQSVLSTDLPTRTFNGLY
jgi:cellulose synthase operon protein C